MEKKTKIINLYGGPGTGKSTSAAYLYYLLKSLGKNVELVREYVKDWAWEKRNISSYDQLYLFGKQSRRESMLYGRVEYIVTDSPVLQGLYYADKYCPTTIARGLENVTDAFYLQAMNDGHQHFHVFLNRSKEYNPEGRYQTLDQALEIDKGVKRLLDRGYVKVFNCDTDEKSLKTFLHERILV
jgi:hypothetical protein